MAGLTQQGNALDADPSRAHEWIQPDPSAPPGSLALYAYGATQSYKLLPLSQVVHESYTVYFNFSQVPTAMGAAAGNHSFALRTVLDLARKPGGHTTRTAVD